MVRLAEALALNAQLTMLDLSNCALDGGSCEALSAGLRENQTLVRAAASNEKTRD